MAQESMSFHNEKVMEEGSSPKHQGIFSGKIKVLLLDQEATWKHHNLVIMEIVLITKS